MAVTDDILGLGEASLESQDIHSLIIDMDGVTFIDSTTLSALIRLRNMAETVDKKLILTNLPSRVTRLFELGGLSTVFVIG